MCPVWMRQGFNGESAGPTLHKFAAQDMGPNMKMDNRILAFAVLGLVFSAGASAADDPANMEQQLKSGVISGCMKRGIERGSNTDAVYAFCSCTWDVISHSVSLAEFFEMQSVQRVNGDPASLSFWGRLTKELQACKDREASTGKR
jgi:hypothetical protein